MIEAVIYLIETLDTNQTLEERDCASIVSFMENIVRGQCIAYATKNETTKNELDFDRFHADVVEKTNLLNTLSSIIKMDQYTLWSVQTDQQSADGIAVSAGLVMKVHTVNILSQLCLNRHNGEALCNQYLIT